MASLPLDILEETLPNECVRKLQNVINNIPKNEFSWNRVLSSLEDARRLQKRLTLDISPTTDLRLILPAYAERIETLIQLGAKHEAEYLKIIAILTSYVVIQDFERRFSRRTKEHSDLKKLAYDGIRTCFRAAGSIAGLQDKVIERYIRAATQGPRICRLLVKSFHNRAYELPLSIPTFLNMALVSFSSNRADEYFLQKLESEYKSGNLYYPLKKDWDSRIISIPTIIHLNFKGKLNKTYIYYLLGEPVDDYMGLRITLDREFYTS
ncbi:hypothetical protein V8C37DRAFT_397780 [Trichoderma ceciliae]